MKRTSTKKATEGGRKSKLQKPTIDEDAIGDFDRATGTSSQQARNDILIQVTRLLRLSKNPDELQAQVKGIIALLKGIAPKGELEGMLAAQMVAVHTVAMDCLACASLPEQTFHGRQLYFAHAEKLLALYARQVEVLDKHRGKGQQQVTVKYVNVESGGQAVVGNVRSDGARPPPNKRKTAQPVIVDQTENSEPMKIAPIREKTAARRRR